MGAQPSKLRLSTPVAFVLGFVSCLLCLVAVVLVAEHAASGTASAPSAGSATATASAAAQDSSRGGGTLAPGPTACPASATLTPVATPVRATITPAPPDYSLALLSVRGGTEYGFLRVEGQIKNISPRPIEHIEAVVTWYDADGGFVKSGNALIEYDPLLPGQTSPFTVLMTENPAARRYTVAFKTFWGSQLPTRYDTAK